MVPKAGFREVLPPGTQEDTATLRGRHVQGGHSERDCRLSEPGSRGRPAAGSRTRANPRQIPSSDRSLTADRLTDLVSGRPAASIALRLAAFRRLALLFGRIGRFRSVAGVGARDGHGLSVRRGLNEVHSHFLAVPGAGFANTV